MIVKSLSRGLAVLCAVNQHRLATVKQLVDRTALPKPTLIRLLQSLVAEGYVESASDGTGYRVGARSRQLTSGFENSRYAEVAQSPLKTLGDAVKFPTIFYRRDGNYMWIETSNRQSAPIQLAMFGADRAAMIGSAAGIAYLSALSQTACSELVSGLITEETSAADSDEIEKVIENVASTKKCGYSQYAYPHLMTDLKSVGVPVCENGKPIGALVFLYLADIVSDEHLQQKIVPALQNCTSEIGQLLSENETTGTRTNDKWDERA